MVYISKHYSHSITRNTDVLDFIFTYWLIFSCKSKYLGHIISPKLLIVAPCARVMHWCQEDTLLDFPLYHVTMATAIYLNLPAILPCENGGLFAISRAAYTVEIQIRCLFLHFRGRSFELDTF